MYICIYIYYIILNYNIIGIKCFNLFFIVIMSLCQIRSFSDPMSMLTESKTMLAWLGISLVIYGWYLFTDYLLDFTNFEIRTIWDSVFWTIFYIILAAIQYEYIWISLGYELKSLFELKSF